MRPPRTRQALVLVAAVAAAMLRAGTAAADGGIVPLKVVAKVSIPLSGVVFEPDTGENVAIAGHLLVQQTLGFPADLIKIQDKAKLGRDVTVVGQTSGLSYRVRGSSNVKYFHPGNPCRQLSQVATFVLVPVDPIVPTDPWRVQYEVTYDVNQAVTTSDATILAPVVPGSCTAVAQACN